MWSADVNEHLLNHKQENFLIKFSDDKAVTLNTENLQIMKLF